MHLISILSYLIIKDGNFINIRFFQYNHLLGYNIIGFIEFNFINPGLFNIKTKWKFLPAIIVFLLLVNEVFTHSYFDDIFNEKYAMPYIDSLKNESNIENLVLIIRKDKVGWESAIEALGEINSIAAKDSLIEMLNDESIYQGKKVKFLNVMKKDEDNKTIDALTSLAENNNN